MDNIGSDKILVKGMITDKRANNDEFDAQLVIQKSLEDSSNEEDEVISFDIKKNKKSKKNVKGRKRYKSKMDEKNNVKIKGKRNRGHTDKKIKGKREKVDVNSDKINNDRISGSEINDNKPNNDDEISHKNVNKEESVEESFEEDSFELENGTVLVIILKCETRFCDKNIANLKLLFSDPYFIVQVCSVDQPNNIPTVKNLTSSQYLENYYMRKALNYAAEGPYSRDISGVVQSNHWWSDKPCIIVKDSSVSNVNPFYKNDKQGGMKKRIQVALDKAKEADLHFLCKWGDNCNKFVDVKGTSNIDNGSSLKWSVKPTSSQAIMYTPKSRDFIRNKLSYSLIPIGELLNSYIAKGELLATAFVPNIIDYDIDLSTDERDYAKLSECDTETSSTSQTSTQQWIWLLIIIFILITLAVILTIFTAKRNFPGSK